MNKTFTRRKFLALAGTSALAAGAVPSFLSGCGLRTRAEPVDATLSREHAQTFYSSEWDLLAAVQDHLLPSAPDAPGAKDVNATGYLDAALRGSDVNPEEAKIIKRGLPSLHELSQKHGGAFATLRDDEKEKVLREFEVTDDGSTWLNLVMAYSLEAYLGDPAYGGNPNGIVWEWLEHKPGFPQPPLMQIGMRR